MRTPRRFIALVGGAICFAALSTASAEEQTTTATTNTATTQPAATPPATPDEFADKKEDEIVCKKLDAPTGSRIGAKKVCKTVAEWRRIQAAAKETMDEIQSRKVPESVN